MRKAAHTLELDVKLAVDQLVPLQDFAQATPAVLIFLLWVWLAVRQGVVVVRFLQGRSYPALLKYVAA
jgi:hypothetical protein